MLTAQLFSAADASSSKTSAPFQKGDLTTFSVQFVFSSATLNGTVSLDCSNDSVSSPDLVTNWIQISASPISVVSGEPAMINVTNGGYRWVRAVWTASTGTGTVTSQLVVPQPANRF